MSAQKPILVIVVPCYNEEEVLSETAKRLSLKITELIGNEIVSQKSALLFVDDGSSDNTWALIEKCHNENNELFNGIKLSANKGQRNAILCGLLSVKDYADVTITMDADLQDDPEAIGGMLERHLGGAEIVYGVRSGREADGFFKRTFARLFYRAMRLLGAGLVYDHADFRLMSRKALAALGEYGEANLFLRGIVPMLGFKTDIVHYVKNPRFAGKSKYGPREMLDLAAEALTSLSVKPLRFILLLGALIFTIGLALAVLCSIRYFSGGGLGPMAVLLCSIWLIGGVIVLSVGVAGEYIGKIYAETKRRPRYHIERTLFRRELADDAE